MFDFDLAKHTDCDGITRRDFLRVGGLTILGMTLPDFLKAANASGTKKDISVILLWMGGGPSHIDTFDPKPDAPQEIRGEFKAIPTNVSGIQISDRLPKLAKQMDKFSIVRSLTSPDSSHETATHYLLTGYPGNPTISYPAFGSVIGKEKGAQNGMPPNMIFGSLPFGYGGAGYMGATYNPFSINGDPNNPGFTVRDVSPPHGVDMDRMARRKSILDSLDTFQKDVESRQKIVQSMDDFYTQAFSLVTSPVAKKAFDLKQEPDKLRDAYGRNYFGQSCLLARRLVEAGVRLITVNYGGWDTHTDNFTSLKNHLLPTVDSGYSALLEDLKQKGMLDTTLVVWMGEFGRTPKVNSSAGRDHWSQGMCVCMGGGGVKTGMVVGSTNERAEMPKDRPVRVEDMAATIYKAVGVDYEKEYITPENRPVKINYDGEPISELLA